MKCCVEVLLLTLYYTMFPLFKGDFGVSKVLNSTWQVSSKSMSQCCDVCKQMRS